MAYKPGTGQDFLLRSDFSGGNPDVRNRFISNSWESITGGFTGAPGQGVSSGPMSWYQTGNPATEPEGFAVSGGSIDDNGTQTAGAPPIGDASRKIHLYNWDTDSWLDPFDMKKISRAPNVPNQSVDFPDNLMWGSGSSMTRPRLWDETSLFIHTFADAASDLAPILQVANGWGIYRATKFDAVNDKVEMVEVDFRKTADGGPGGSLTPVQHDVGYHDVWGSWIVAVDTPGILWMLEQHGTRSGTDLIPAGNATITKMDLNITPIRGQSIDTGFQIGTGQTTSNANRSSLIYNHGENKSELYFYESGSNDIRIYDWVTNQWTIDSSGPQRFGPFDTSAPETPYVWYFDASGGFQQELLPDAEAPAGTGDFKFAYTFVDNVGAESAGSPIAEITAAKNSTVTLNGISTGPTGVAKRRIYGSLADQDTMYFIQEIDDNTTTSATVTTDDSDRDVARIMPDELDNQAPPEGPRIVSSFKDNLIYMGTSDDPQKFYYTKDGEPDNVPFGNEEDLGLERDAIIQGSQFGDSFVFRKKSETWVLDEIGGKPRLVLNSRGAKSIQSVVNDPRLGDIVVDDEEVYAFDLFNYTPISEVVAGDWIKDLLDSNSVFVFEHDRKVHMVTESGSSYVYEPIHNRWVSKDSYNFTVRGVRLIRGSHNLGASNTVNGVWAISNDSAARFLENEEAKFDNATWDGSKYNVKGAQASDFTQEFETQSLLIDGGREVNAYAFHVESILKP
jgi:hypothetical protein